MVRTMCCLMYLSPLLDWLPRSGGQRADECKCAAGQHRPSPATPPAGGAGGCLRVLRRCLLKFLAHQIVTTADVDDDIL
jgi:hypothetical protein